MKTTSAKLAKQPVISEAKTAQPHFLLQLYVVGTTPASLRAVVNVRKLCEQHLNGRYELNIIDLSKDPSAAAAAQIIAAPTLIKQSPQPTRRFIGDMSNEQRILDGLGVAAHAPTELAANVI